MNRIKAYRLLTILILFSSCSERVTVSDVDSLGLRYNVKSMDESFYIVHNSFDSIVLDIKIYHYKYKFYHDCRYKSVEKKFYYNKLPYCPDSIDNASKSDSIKQCFPFAYKEPEYSFVNYKYADSLTILEFFDRQGELKNYINRKYANKRLQYEEKYSGTGDLISKTRFLYNHENKLTNKTIFYKDNYVKTDYTYSIGKKIETGGDEFDYHYQFDVNGKISSKKTYKNITLVAEMFFYYNNYGDIIETRRVYENRTVNKTLYSYTYDSRNNWILCIEYNYTGNIFVRKREITYYS